MSDLTDNKKYEKPRILMFSQRNIYKQHFRAAFYEFEDLICNLDAVELLAPKPNKWFKYGTRAGQRLATDYYFSFNPGFSKIKIKETYDLFFVGSTFAKDLLNIKCIEGWRDRCRIAVCWIEEIWTSKIFKSRYFLDMMSQFDKVIVNCKQSVNAINDVLGNKCFYLPPGIDTILFCPYPDNPHRFIDVYSIGRRSEETHRSLLKMAMDKKIFYVFDSIDGNHVPNSSQHRFLYSSMAKRSKYFIANPSKIDEIDETKGQIEIGPRYFEGASSGTVMIGDYPKSEQFDKNFNWKDSVIHIPFDSENIFDIIMELENDPKRIENIRRSNVVGSLMRHDWVYRWEEVLKIARLNSTPSLLERKIRLNNLSNS